jgi:hypothetical protein
MAAACGKGDGRSAGASEDSATLNSTSDACNGHVELCDRTLDAVTLPGTHNSFASEADGFARYINANHTVGVAEQLTAGVRVFLLDVYEEDGQRVLCHGPCTLGSLGHVDVLSQMAAFVEQHPREVLAIVYQDSASPEAIAEDLGVVGLAEHAITHTPGDPWPTLGSMIDAQTQLLVMLEYAGPPPEWMHQFSDLAWDTPYAWKAIEEFDCRFGRGDPDNPLLQVNHWLSTELGLPDADRAAETNSFDILYGHAAACLEDPGDHPNFLVVDYHLSGDLFAVVDALNGL